MGTSEPRQTALDSWTDSNGVVSILSGAVENSPTFPQVNSAGWVTGSIWQALLVWPSVSALPVPSPQRRGQTEVTGQQQGMEVSKLTFYFDAVSAKVKEGAVFRLLSLICTIGMIFLDKTHTAHVSPQMVVANTLICWKSHSPPVINQHFVKHHQCNYPHSALVNTVWACSAIWILINNLSGLTTSLHNTILFMRAINANVWFMWMWLWYYPAGTRLAPTCLKTTEMGEVEKKEGVREHFPLSGWKIKQQEDPHQQSACWLSNFINPLSQLLCLSEYKHVQCEVCTCIVCMAECAFIFFYLYSCKKEIYTDIDREEWEDRSLVPWLWMPKCLIKILNSL